MNHDKNGTFAKGNTCSVGIGRPREWTEEKLDDLAEDLLEWIDEARKKSKFVLLSEWCFDRGVLPQIVPRYCSYSPKFKEAYQWAKSWQEQMVAKGALTKTLESRFSQFFLAVNHGWTLDKDRENKEDKQKSNLEKMSEALHTEVEKES